MALEAIKKEEKTLAQLGNEYRVHPDHLSNGTDLFYHYDPIGNVLMISNASGDTIASYCQEGFGNVIQTVGSVDNDYHLTTKEIDSDTGLYYFYARWYDPEIGRFISKDIIPSINFYYYAQNNPLGMMDPTGMEGTSVADAAKDCVCSKGSCCDWVRCIIDNMKDKNGKGPSYGDMEPYPKDGTDGKAGDILCWFYEKKENSQMCNHCVHPTDADPNPGGGHIGIITTPGHAQSCSGYRKTPHERKDGYKSGKWGSPRSIIRIQ